jgi:hypothetical protein
MLHLEHSFLWFGKVDTSERRSEIPGKFWNLVLEKDGNQLDWSCEKWRSVTKSQGLEEYPTREGRLTGFVTSCVGKPLSNTLLKERWKWRKDEEEGVSVNWMTLRERGGYSKLKEKASDRTLWRTRFEKFYGPVGRQTAEWMDERTWECYLSRAMSTFC